MTLDTPTNADIMRSVHDAQARLGLEPEFATIESYWRDPAPFEAERTKGQVAINALFADHEANVLRHMQAIWDKEGN